jgi:hypothetical protein
MGTGEERSRLGWWIVGIVAASVALLALAPSLLAETVTAELPAVSMESLCSALFA